MSSYDRLARLATLAALCLPTLAFAQAADVPVPAPTCSKPVVPAIGAPLSKAAAEKLNAESSAYAGCADSYIKSLRATAASHQAIANKHTEASNAFVAEFNAFGAALTAFSKARAEAAKAAE